MAGSTLVSSLTLLFCILLPLCAAQASCRGRCGESFIRGQLCNCDYDCLTHNECCKDYENFCTSRGSCLGRCGESFRRGRECECDPDCTLYNTCCSDYHGQCDSADPAPVAKSGTQSKLKAQSLKKPDVQQLTSRKKPSESESEERSQVLLDNADGLVTSTISPAVHRPDAIGQGFGPSDLYNLGELMSLTRDPTGAPLPLNPSFHLSPPVSPTVNTPALGGLAGDLPHPGVSSSGNPLTIPAQLSLSISGHVGGHASRASIQLPSSLGAGRPNTLEDIAQALGAKDPADPTIESSSPDLCNGLPIDALTSLFNGSTIIFRGNFFWFLDPKTRTPGPAQNITDLGIPSPIDTAFTRCNCQGKTYIIKGGSYWVFENGVMETGYPRSLSQDFGGLSGEITAALSVPATRKGPEAIYFFKKGGTAQKFSFPAESSPSCTGKKVKNSVYNKIRRTRQAASSLSAEININLKWKGFPTPVTSALSAPNPKKPDGFDYLVISWPKFFSIKISGEFPALASPAKAPAQQNYFRNLLNCP